MRAHFDITLGPTGSRASVKVNGQDVARHIRAIEISSGAGDPTVVTVKSYATIDLHADGELRVERYDPRATDLVNLATQVAGDTRYTGPALDLALLVLEQFDS